MPAIQLPLGPAQLHANQQLFSDYYLDQILPQRADWRLLTDEAAAALARIRAIYAGFTPSSIEAQTEDDLIKPVLAALGHSFEVQAALRSPDGTKRPDYLFYRDQAARDANKGRTLDDTLPSQGALAVGDAKAWDRPLDTALKVKGGDPFTNKNPSYQIAFYIQHSGLPWGILTNGRRWRLYHKDTAHKLDRFYEVDLPELLECNDPAAFLAFYGFFRRAAFDAHPLGLDTLLQASSEFARGIGDNLKEQVYTALRHLAQGFLDYGPNRLQPDPAPLKTIYDHCLIVLYRLLFALYAEARELLPLRESEAYRRGYSLEAIKRQVAETIDSGLPLLAESATIWPRLRTLFGIINAGSPPLKVSTFNGGLFDPARYPFLETHSIGDARLLQALDLLTRVNGQYVDYRDLAERHLGTIYEGLLEYHLVVIGPHPPVPLLPDREKGEWEHPHPPSPLLPDQEKGEWERIAIDPALRAQMVEVAQAFRKQPTPSEQILWQALRNRQLAGRKFRRQQPIGPFVVDFFCPEERLIVEVDGPIHALQQEADAARQRLLEQAGYLVIRITTQTVEQSLDTALATISGQFNQPHRIGTTPHPQPLPRSGRGALNRGGTPPLPVRERGLGGEGFTIDLVDSQGERHRTGSYYTPDFVVQYIVEQTLRPVLDAAVAGKATDAERAAAVLAVNVLDLSMGSGHFPVAATEFIARYLVDLGVPPGAETAQVPRSTGDAAGGGEPDVAYWKRRVAQSCIYGVDLNPLAVDLAKLSLWLSTAAKDRPLSFLDHHLRCGNAVVGVRLSDLDLGGAAPRKARPSAKAQAAAAAGQLSMLDDDGFTRSMSTAVGAMWLIEGSAGDTLAEVKEQELAYAAVREELTRRYAHLADLATAAQGFGAPLERTLWPELVRQASRGREAIMLPAIARLLEQAERTAAAQRFFHWDLEFPEVFFDRFGRPLGPAAGFDAVIGNPPYVRQEQLGPYKAFLAAAFPETYHGVADLFVYFYHQGVKLLREGGRLSYIVTNKWLKAGYGEGLRGYFAAQTRIERLIDFGHAPIFADADVFPCIIVLEKPSAQAPLPNPSPSRGEGLLPHRDAESLPPPLEGAGGQEDAGKTSLERSVQVTIFPREALKLVSLDSYVARYSHPVPQARLGRSAWSLEESETDDLMAKIRRAGVPLAEFAGVKPYRGVLTGFNEAFLIDTPTKERLVREDPRSAEIIKPYLRGQDIKRWAPEWDDVWLIVLKSSGDHAWPWAMMPEAEAEATFRQTYPALHGFMKPLEERLRKRQDQGRHWWELRSCAYYAAFEQPKIMYQVIQFHPQYGLNETQALTNDKGFFIPVADPWLLAVLNSPLMWWHNWRFLPHMKDEALNPAGFLMEQLPIAPAPDAALAEAGPAVGRLIAIAQADQGARRDMLDWLRSEHGVAEAGQKLADSARLSAEEFIAEVKKRRPKAAGALTPATLKALRAGYSEQATPMQQWADEARALERRLAALVTRPTGRRRRMWSGCGVRRRRGCRGEGGGTRGQGGKGARVRGRARIARHMATKDPKDPKEERRWLLLCSLCSFAAIGWAAQRRGRREGRRGRAARCALAPRCDPTRYNTEGRSALRPSALYCNAVPYAPSTTAPTATPNPSSSAGGARAPRRNTPWAA